MKFLLYLFTFMFFVSISYSSDEMLPRVHPDKIPPVKTISIDQINPNFDYNKLKEYSGDKIQAVNFYILDSLGNAYSVLGNTQPYVYDRDHGSLIFIKRGFYSLLTDPNYAGDNQKNNLFIRKSADWGQNWDDPIIVYDEKIYNMDQARYPSVCGYDYQGTPTIGFTAPMVLETQGKWTKTIMGFYNDIDGEVNLAIDSSFIFNNNYYEWSTDSRMVGKTIGSANDPTIFVVGGVSSVSGDLAENSNIAIRKTGDYSDVDITIPSAWASSKFTAVTAAGFRANEVVKLLKGPNDRMFMGAFGGFLSGDISGRAIPGFSYSDDNGETWSEFDVFPFSLARTYAGNMGADPDSCFFPYTSKDMTVMDNGDISFALFLTESNNTKPFNQGLHQLVEVYKENGAWGIRKIADIYGSWMTYIDLLDNNNSRYNPLDYELQMSRTVDGNQLLAKWVDLIGVRDTIVNGETISIYTTTDIYAASRNAGSGVWSPKSNITNDFEKERTVFIPDYLPNDLVGVPIMRLAAIIDPNLPANSQRLQADSTTNNQYLLLGFYDFEVGVDDEPVQTGTFSLNNIYPNPASDIAYIDFTTPGYGDVRVDIYDLTGQIVIPVFNNNTAEGLHSVKFDASNLGQGAYYCRMTFNGHTISKMITILR